MNIERAKEIVRHLDEFSLLYRYLNIPLDELNEFVEVDLMCMKAFYKNFKGDEYLRATKFVAFLREFKFYIQGSGTTFPANFKDIDYRQTYGERKLLSDEMVRMYGLIVEKSNGKTSTTAN